ncbi:MAG TPA: DUF4142 domain-containing protein [Thermoanaerobaculia bacterium]|nr:DUF4142 domain-containing protein [Thermoanaerobaculia bacterium]
MKRTGIFLLAFIAVLMFACQNEQNASNNATATDTAASATDTATSSTETTATDTTGTATATTSSAAVTSTAPLNASDSDFARKAAEGGMMEVDLGQLAAAKATSQDVKDFGNKMVADHGKANDELKALASQKGLTLPTTPGAEEKTTSNALEKKTGAAFDKAYMSDMVKDHEKDAKEFKNAVSKIQDPDLKNWASNTLTVIQGHLDLAKQVDSKVK